jgi:hypothetical protein
VCGGQSGADRAAVDVALAIGVSYGGWIPKGGWAEDHPFAPGLLDPYLAFSENDTADLELRTARNVHDADATLVFLPASVSSSGTELTVRQTEAQGRPSRIVDPFCPTATEETGAFLRSLRPGSTLNVAGPRASECPGIYAAVQTVLLGCRDDLLGPSPSASPPSELESPST